LTVRVIFSLFAQRPGKELEDYQNLTQMLPMGSATTCCASTASAKT